MSGQPRPIERTRDKKGRPQYLARLPIWKRYPRTFIIGGGCFFGCMPWIYQLYQALFFTEADVPYQANWWPSEKARGKRIIDQYRENREKQKIWEEEFKQHGDVKAATKKMMEKTQTKPVPPTPVVATASN